MQTFRFLSRLGLPAALAFLAAPLPAAEPSKLDRVAVVRFTAVGSDRLQRTQGILHFDGRATWSASSEVPRPANLPEWAVDRPLIAREAWFAYRGLGFNALAFFQLGANSVAIPVGEERFWLIEPNPDAVLTDGRVINISTRARLASAGDRVIAGFVIEGRPRQVLVRGIGPGLTAFGVANTLADPVLSVRRGQDVLATNDDWSAPPDAGAIREAASLAGAFPLATGSKDAALLVELPPGAYTVALESAGPAVNGGEVLVEIYRMPEQF